MADLLFDMARLLPAAFELLWLDSLPFLWLNALEPDALGPALPRTESKKVLSAIASFGIVGPGLFLAGVIFCCGAVLV